MSIRIALTCVFLALAGCIYYADGHRQDDHDGYGQDRCYDTEYGRRCRHGGEDDQGEDEQD